MYNFIWEQYNTYHAFTAEQVLSFVPMFITQQQADDILSGK